MLRGLATFLVVTLSFVLDGDAAAREPLVIRDLAVPRGLSPAGSDLLVADQGNARILRVTPNGTIGVVVDGLPSGIVEAPEGDVFASVTGVVDAGGTYFFTTGGEGVRGLGSVFSVAPGREPVLIADLAAYERAHNTDGDVDLTGAPELLSNLYDVAPDGAGGLFVSDSAANAILRVSLAGEVSPFAVFPNVPNPLFPALGGPEMDQVPTGIETGPDGALYVATLTGFPFPDGGAVVYRLADGNGDGDARDSGEMSVYARGITTGTNLAFDRDGSLLVTEFSRDFLAEAPGRLVRVRGGTITEVVAEPLISPTGVTVMKNGDVIVAQEFLGIVADAGSAAPEAPPSAQAGGGAEIRPPATGDAGLKTAAPATATAFVAVAAAALVAIAWLSARRVKHV